MSKLVFARVLQTLRGTKDGAEVEVKHLVMCKDCAYAIQYRCDSASGQPMRRCINGRFAEEVFQPMVVPEDWYCADGIKKTGNEKYAHVIDWWPNMEADIRNPSMAEGSSILCGNCKTTLRHSYGICPSCGALLDWSDRRLVVNADWL